MNVKANIKRIREQRDYTQEYVAAQLGITQQAYQQIETGDTKVTAELLARLALIFHVRVEQFYGVEQRHHEEDNHAGKQLLLFEKLVKAKDDLIATKDKVIELQQIMLQDKKGKTG